MSIELQVNPEDYMMAKTMCKTSLEQMGESVRTVLFPLSWNLQVTIHALIIGPFDVSFSLYTHFVEILSCPKSGTCTKTSLFLQICISSSLAFSTF